MDRAHWTSPSFRGGGRPPHPRHSNPRFRGDGNNFGTPTRHFSPHWQQRSPSPYRYQYQSQQGQGPSFSSHYHQGHHPYATSTPVHGSGGGRRPFFRGGGRFNKRQSFGAPSFGKGGSGGDIESWISPEMWADPWRHLTSSTTPSLSSTQVSGATAQEGTRFAESDFDITPSKSESCIKEIPLDGASTTKFADSDFNVTDDSKSIVETDQQTHQDGTSASSLTEPVGVKSNNIARTIEDDDEFEKYATDRVVLDADEDQLLS